jgi:hypothetical protein
VSTLSAELTRYLVWGGVIAIGALLAVLDRRWIRRPLFAVLLVAGVIGGLIITRVVLSLLAVAITTWKA